MMKQKPSFSILLLLLLVVSVFFNFTLYQDQKTAKDKIERFLPAAVQVENELLMLRNNNKELMNQLSVLQLQMDSSKKRTGNYSAIAPSIVPQQTEAYQPVNPSLVAPGTQQGDFKDLQKPKGKQ